MQESSGAKEAGAREAGARNPVDHIKTPKNPVEPEKLEPGKPEELEQPTHTSPAVMSPPVAPGRNSCLRGYKANHEERRQHDREYKAFFRAVKASNAQEVSKEWMAAGRSTMKKGMMMSRWKAGGCDLVQMVIRDKLIRERREESVKVWTWKTRSEMLVRLNQNIELVDSIIRVKRRDGLARENPDAPGCKESIQYKMLKEQSERERQKPRNGDTKWTGRQS